MPAYYNEIEPYAAAWLRNLIAAGHIAPGDVDERSIAEVAADDFVGYTQCHFFAGIGGWSYALRLSGWPDDLPVWTGSCPCQPFSAAGKGAGTKDPRHLWPEWFRLIRQCRPDVIFGEQVEAAVKHGWLDLVSADLEGEGYAVGAVAIPAGGVGAPHIRQRLWFVADRSSERLLPGAHARIHSGEESTRPRHGKFERHGATEFLADNRRGSREPDGLLMAGAPSSSSSEAREQRVRADLGAGGDFGVLADRQRTGLEGSDPRAMGDECATVERGGAAGFWAACDWIPCTDGKKRPTQPGIFPLVDGVRSGRVAVGSAVGQTAALLSAEEAAHEFSRVGTLRGAGNAIVPQAAAEVIRAYLECRP